MPNFSDGTPISAQECKQRMRFVDHPGIEQWGKGDNARPFSVSKEQFAANWDYCFNGKKDARK